jgi:hypothetical protein
VRHRIDQDDLHKIGRRGPIALEWLSAGWLSTRSYLVYLVRHRHPHFATLNILPVRFFTFDSTPMLEHICAVQMIAETV